MPQCGDCLYEWIDDAWVMIDGCENGCVCGHPPSIEGTPGQVATIPCDPAGSASRSSTITALGIVIWSPWYRPGDEKHSIMLRTNTGWRYYFYGPDRISKIQPQNELLVAYPIGTLLVVGKDAEILGTGMLGKVAE